MTAMATMVVQSYARSIDPASGLNISLPYTRCLGWLRGDEIHRHPGIYSSRDGRERQSTFAKPNDHRLQR
jgi:hypothetical protein